MNVPIYKGFESILKIPAFLGDLLSMGRQDQNYFSDKFIAQQIAGSSRMEGINISKKIEKMTEEILAGNLDGEKARLELVMMYKNSAKRGKD